MKGRLASLRGLVTAMPLSSWALPCFIASYLLFFVKPVFFAARGMQFPHYVPSKPDVGIDLHQMLNYSYSWFVEGKTPYVGLNLYPPLTSVLFVLVLLLPFTVAYRAIVLVSLLCFVVITYALPTALQKGRAERTMPLLILVTGLFSYGLQFELERGQFNVIAMSMCFASLWIYDRHPRYRPLAHVLFTLSVQLKVYPFIFILLFLVGRPFGKADAARALALSLVNFGLLFVLGPRVFVEFLHAIRAQVLHPYSWAANHSIRSFVTVTWGGGSPDHGANWVGRHADAVQLGLLASVAACLLVVARRAHAQERGRISASLLLACTLGALLIPSVSDDYKLPILGPPLALYFADLSVDARDLRGIARGLLVVPSCALALAYTSTLFSYTNKPAALQNNCGALIVMLLAVTGMSFVCSRRRPEQPGEGVASASLT